jgi:PAS domain S-box-containing protein
MTRKSPSFTDHPPNGETGGDPPAHWTKRLEYLQDFVEFSPIGIVTLQQSGTVLTCNLMFSRLLETHRSNLLDRSFYDHVAWDDRDLLYLHLRSIFRHRQSASVELTLNTASGDTRRVRMESKFDIHPKGRPECRSMITDLTDIRRTEAALHASLAENRRHLAQMDALFQQMTEGIFLFDAKGVLLRVNRAGQRIWGYKNDLPLNLPFDDVIDAFEVFDLKGNPLPKERYPFYRVLSGESLSGYEVRVHCKPTGRSWIGAYGGTPIYDDDGGKIFYLVTVRDISAQHQARVEIEESRNRLKQLNETLEARVAERTAEVERLAGRLRGLATEMSRVEQRERRRLANVLHDDLQQTLAAVQLQLNACRRSHDVEKIHLTAGSALEMVTESIELARDLSRQLSPPVLKESGLTEGLRWLAGRMAEQQQFTVTIQNEGVIEPIPEEMRFFLFECVREVLFNAVKYAGTGEAEVTLERDPSGEVRIMVEDQGFGFDAEALENRDAEDITFGLFSIRERMAHLGGTVEIESAPGEGCRVTLTAPTDAMPATELSAAAKPSPATEPSPAAAAEPPPPPPPAEPAEPPAGTIRILVVEDHTLVRQGLVGMLDDEHDMTVVGEAADGREALEKADALRPDLILMDVNLPEINGIDATHILSGRHPNTPVIGLSMHADDAVADAMKTAGAVAYLTKDGPAESLVGTIRETAGAGAGG